MMSRLYRYSVLCANKYSENALSVQSCRIQGNKNSGGLKYLVMLFSETASSVSAQTIISLDFEWKAHMLLQTEPQNTCS